MIYKFLTSDHDGMSKVSQPQDQNKPWSPLNTVKHRRFSCAWNFHELFAKKSCCELKLRTSSNQKFWANIPMPRIREIFLSWNCPILQYQFFILQTTSSTELLNPINMINPLIVLCPRKDYWVDFYNFLHINPSDDQMKKYDMFAPSAPWFAYN